MVGCGSSAIRRPSTVVFGICLGKCVSKAERQWGVGVNEGSRRCVFAQPQPRSQPRPRSSSTRQVSLVSEGCFVPSVRSPSVFARGLIDTNWIVTLGVDRFVRSYGKQCCLRCCFVVFGDCLTFRSVAVICIAMDTVGNVVYSTPSFWNRFGLQSPATHPNNCGPRLLLSICTNVEVVVITGPFT